MNLHDLRPKGAYSAVKLPNQEWVEAREALRGVFGVALECDIHKKIGAGLAVECYQYCLVATPAQLVSQIETEDLSAAALTAVDEEEDPHGLALVHFETDSV